MILALFISMACLCLLGIWVQAAVLIGLSHTVADIYEVLDAQASLPHRKTHGGGYGHDA